MGIEKIRLLACELVYWINKNAAIENTFKQCAKCMGYQQRQPSENIIPYKVFHKPWEVVGADINTIKNNTLLCIVDYYCKFPLIKRQMPFQLTA